MGTSNEQVGLLLASHVAAFAAISFSMVQVAYDTGTTWQPLSPLPCSLDGLQLAVSDTWRLDVQ